MSYPNRLGNNLSIVPVCPKIRTSTRARKKYGIAWKKVAAGSTHSTEEPRRQAIKVPIVVPPTKLKMVARPRRPRVHGREEAIRLLTGAFSDQECPRSPRARFPMYWMYWSHRLVWTL